MLPHVFCCVSTHKVGAKENEKRKKGKDGGWGQKNKVRREVKEGWGGWNKVKERRRCRYGTQIGCALNVVHNILGRHCHFKWLKKSHLLYFLSASGQWQCQLVVFIIEILFGAEQIFFSVVNISFIDLFSYGHHLANGEVWGMMDQFIL